MADKIRSYLNRKGKQRFAPLPHYAEELDAESCGFCICCGNSADCVEPDAVRYTCEHCGQNGVYGIEELALLGVIK